MSFIVPMEKPKRCGLCPCFHAEHPMHCQAVKAHKDKRIIAPYGAPIPDWCPLIELPPAYEEKKKQNDKIEVGDEVRHKEYKNRFVVTKMQDGHAYGISKDGSWNNFRNDGSVVKTGRHFDIEKILEEMRE